MKPARVARERAQHDRQQHCDEGCDRADLERIAPAVEQPHGDIAAVGVGAEQEAPFPGRTDRHASGGDDIDLLAANVHRLGDVVVVGAGVGDVVRVHRRQQAQRDDHHEQCPGRERDSVAREGLHDLIIASLAAATLNPNFRRPRTGVHT